MHHQCVLEVLTEALEARLPRQLLIDFDLQAEDLAPSWQVNGNALYVSDHTDLFNDRFND